MTTNSSSALFGGRGGETGTAYNEVQAAIALALMGYGAASSEPAAFKALVGTATLTPGQVLRNLPATLSFSWTVGFLMPGVVDLDASPVEQAAQIMDKLRRQGLSESEAFSLAADLLQDRSAVPLPPLSLPSVESLDWSPEELSARVAEVERHLADELTAQQVRDDSLLGADDLAALTGGGGNRGLSRAPIQPVLNGNFDAALNAVADLTGTLQVLADTRSALGELQAAQAQGKIETIRSTLRAAGVPNVPDDYERALVPGGAIVPDYGATIDKLQTIYTDFLRDKRLTETWGSNWQNLRIGRSQMTVQEFETKVLRLQQQATDDAYGRGVELIATKQLPIGSGGYAQTLGNYIDQQVRLQLRDFGRFESIADSSASNIFAVNRQIRGQGLIGIPDLRLGGNLISDVSLAAKSGATLQLQNWNYMRPNDTIVIHPSNLLGGNGGAYVVPRNTIAPPHKP